MPFESLHEAIDAVQGLQEQLLYRQRRLKGRHAPDGKVPWNASSDLALLLDALQKITNVEPDAAVRLEKQTTVLTTLALLFSLIKLEETQSVSPEAAKQAFENAWLCWPPGGAHTAILRCREITRSLLALPELRDGVTEHILERCRRAPLASKRTIACLQELMDSDQHQRVRAAFPNLDEQCIDLLGQGEVSTPAGKLCISLLARKTSFAAVADQSEAVALLRRALLGHTEVARQAAASHLLPLVAKVRPELLRALFSSVAADGAGHLATFLVVAQSGFSSAILSRSEIADDLLLASIASANTKIRSSTLVLLSEAPSAAMPLTEVDLEILEALFRYDMGPTDGDFRQVVVASWMRILARLRSSSYAADRNARKLRKLDSDDLREESYVSRVKTFLDATLVRIQRALLPHSPYRIQRGALQYLSVLLGSGIDVRYAGELDKAALRTRNQFASQPSAGPLWPFELDICNSVNTRSLLRCLMSTYDDVRNAAFAILLDFPRPLPGYDHLEKSSRDLLKPSMKLMRDRRESACASGAMIADLACRMGGHEIDYVLCDILRAVEEDISVAERDLFEAAKTNPMHGGFVAAKQVLKLSYELERRPDAACHSRMLALVERAWDVVEPILCHASPEGNDMSTPYTNGNGNVDHEDFRAFQALRERGSEILDAPDPHEPAGPRHKVLLSAAWRTAKEAAALLEAAIGIPAAQECLLEVWTGAQLERAVQLFSEWLLDIRHRGAFSAIYPNFSHICSLLIRYPTSPTVQSIPLRQLEALLQGFNARKTSITRRSAGLPYCVLGILSGVSISAPEIVHRTMTTLIATAADTCMPADDRIHAMNTLMVVMIDADLGSHTAGNVEPCFAASMECFSSADWNVRNVAMLLFASLVQRVLGTRASTNSSTLAHGIRRTYSHDFFRKYPGLHLLLYGELKKAVAKHMDDNSTLGQHSSLHAILLLLGLLHTPTRMPGAHEICLTYVPLLRRCASSSIWYIREAAAQAVAGLSAPEDSASILESLCTQSMDDLSNNELHGALLQILCPLRRMDTDSVDILHLSRLFERAYQFTMRDRPWPITETTLQIGIEIVRLGGTGRIPELRSLLDTAEDLVMSNELLQRSPGWQSCCSKAVQLLLGCGRLTLDECMNTPSEQATITALSSSAVPSSNATLKCEKLAMRGPSAQIRTLAAAKLVCSDRYVPAASFKTLFEAYASTSSRTLRDGLLPLLSRIAVDAEDAASVLLLIEAATQEQEAESHREAAVRALARLPAQYMKLPASQHIWLQILQDDNSDIRVQAEAILSVDSPLHGLRVAEIAATRLVEGMGPDAAVARYVLGDCDNLTSHLTEHDVSLFARERANLFKEDAFEIQVIVECAAKCTSAWPLTVTAFERALSRAQTLLFAGGAHLSEPFSLAAQANFSLVVFKLNAAAQVLGDHVTDSHKCALQALCSAVGL